MPARLPGLQGTQDGKAWHPSPRLPSQTSALVRPAPSMPPATLPLTTSSSPTTSKQPDALRIALCGHMHRSSSVHGQHVWHTPLLHALCCTLIILCLIIDACHTHTPGLIRLHASFKIDHQPRSTGSFEHLSCTTMKEDIRPVSRSLTRRFKPGAKRQLNDS